MNQRKLVAATCLGLLLAGFAVARLGPWAGGWSGAGLDAAADALARWVALVAALFAWLRLASRPASVLTTTWTASFCPSSAACCATIPS